MDNSSSGEIRGDLGKPLVEIQEKRRNSRQIRTLESFNAEMTLGVTLSDEVKHNRQRLRKCIQEHEDALNETEILNASDLNDQREWLVQLLQSAKSFMMTVDDDCLSIIDTSRDRKERLDEALTRNGELEQLNSELQGIVDSGGLINRRSSA